MSIAGIDLSQPPNATNASNRSACITVSTESQITSRDTSEARMPSWPIEIPSETVIVPNSIGNPPAERTPALACTASFRNVMLQGVSSFHDEAIATCGLSQSLSVIPTARSIARAGALAMPSVTSLDRILSRGSPISAYPRSNRSVTVKLVVCASLGVDVAWSGWSGSSGGWAVLAVLAALLAVAPRVSAGR